MRGCSGPCGVVGIFARAGRIRGGSRSHRASRRRLRGRPGPRGGCRSSSIAISFNRVRSSLAAAIHSARVASIRSCCASAQRSISAGVALTAASLSSCCRTAGGRCTSPVAQRWTLRRERPSTAGALARHDGPKTANRRLRAPCCIAAAYHGRVSRAWARFCAQKTDWLLPPR